MIGNSQTFKHSRKGQDIWISLFDQLQANGHLYDGLPVRCEQHRSEGLCSASSTTSMSYVLMEGVSKPGTVPLSMVHID
jgi:hypothetical protein